MAASPDATATVTQFASEMAPGITGAQAAYDDYAASLGTNMCGLNLLGAKWSAKTVNITVDTLTNSPTAETYLGTPPAEMAGLMTETQSSARAFMAAVNASKNSCPISDMMAASRWSNTLDKWGPYL